jgi:hypothetical protein
MSALVLKTLWIYGLAAVVSIVIALIIRVIVFLLSKTERKAAPAVAPRPAAPVAEVPEIAHHVAAISAAVYEAIGAHHIVHIEDAGRGAGWAAEGRYAHHSSHSPATRPGRR